MNKIPYENSLRRLAKKILHEDSLWRLAENIRRQNSSIKRTGKMENSENERITSGKEIYKMKFTEWRPEMNCERDYERDKTP